MIPQFESDTEPQITVLVVDDAAVDRLMTGAIIEHKLGWRVEYAEDGASALVAMERQTPRLVLTDLRMKGMNGLELVSAVRKKYPFVPVVLMTAFGNEDIAIQALREGAASYVPKLSIDHNLAPTLQQVIVAARMEHHQQRLRQSLLRTEKHFVLENDVAVIRPVIIHVQEAIAQVGLYDETDRFRIGLVLQESINDAILYGNLEIPSKIFSQGSDVYLRLANERRQQLPYRERRVHFSYKVSSIEAIFIIRNEGLGFDPSALPNPADPSQVTDVRGRAMLLIQILMDEVTFDTSKKQVTLVKRRA